MKSGYDEVMRTLKFKRHQYCIFHLKQAINKQIAQHIKELKQKEKEKIKQEYDDPSDEFIDEEIKRIVEAENN